MRVIIYVMGDYQGGKGSLGNGCYGELLQVSKQIYSGQLYYVKLNRMQEFIEEESYWQIFPQNAQQHRHKPPRNTTESLSNDQQLPAKRSLDGGTKISSKEEKKRLAGLRSRQKKKKYIQILEQSVKQLTEQVQGCQNDISVCKDKLVEAIRNANSSRNNEHSFIFAELQHQISAEFPNLDLINLLIDQLRNRIGANGKERQANLLYNFKQIINSMFPAIYRYFFYIAHHQKELFAEDISAQDLQQISSTWTSELYQNVQFSEPQFSRMRQMRKPLLERRRQAIKHMRRLRQTKQQLKQQGQIFEKLIHNIRSELTPIQSALFTIFAEQNKFRKEFSVTDFQTQEVSNPACLKAKIKDA